MQKIPFTVFIIARLHLSLQPLLPSPLHLFLYSHLLYYSVRGPVPSLHFSIPTAATTTLFTFHLQVNPGRVSGPR